MCFFLIAVTTGFFSNYEAFPTMRLSLKFPLLNILAIEHGRFADCFLACVSFGWKWHMFKACFLFMNVRIPVSFIVPYCYYVCVCVFCLCSFFSFCFFNICFLWGVCSCRTCTEMERLQVWVTFLKQITPEYANLWEVVHECTWTYPFPRRSKNSFWHWILSIWGPILRYIEGIQYIRGLGFAKIPPAGHPPYA